jgi:PPOX class probable F420-dependent enzyme
MDLHVAIDFARDRTQSVLVTSRRNGRPQLSNVIHSVDDAGLVRISITADRAKYTNLRRDPWAALHVSQADFWAYVVLEGVAELSPEARDPADAATDELVDLYRAMAGEHPDWDDYRAAMVRDRRVVVRLRPDRAYGMLGRGSSS